MVEDESKNYKILFPPPCKTLLFLDTFPANPSPQHSLPPTCQRKALASGLQEAIILVTHMIWHVLHRGPKPENRGLSTYPIGYNTKSQLLSPTSRYLLASPHSFSRPSLLLSHRMPSFWGWGRLAKFLPSNSTFYFPFLTFVATYMCSPYILHLCATISITSLPLHRLNISLGRLKTLHPGPWPMLNDLFALSTLHHSSCTQQITQITQATLWMGRAYLLNQIP